MRVTNTPAPPDASPDLLCQRFRKPLLWRIILWFISGVLMMMGPMMIVQIIVLYLLGPPDGSGPKANMLLVAAARLLWVGMGVFCFFVGFYLAYGACEYVEVSEGGVVIGRRNKRRLPWSEIEEATLVLNEPGYYFAPQLTLASGETIVLTVVRGSGEGARSPGGRVVRAIRSGLKSHYDVHRSG